MSLRHFPRIILVGILLIAGGCSNGKPTYPKEHLVESVHALLTKENLTGDVRFTDHTLAIHLDHPNLIVQYADQTAIGSSFEDIAQKLINVVHRILLSSDADVQFYVVILSDPGTPGAYITIVRYVDDIKKAYVNRIDITEMLSRTLFEVKHIPSPSMTPIEQVVPVDIRLEDFLSMQLAHRIQQILMTELQGGGKATVGQCEGSFQQGEFIFTVNVLPANGVIVDEPVMQQAFQMSSATIAKVLASYRFDDFNTVRLIHPLTGRNLVLPKANLEVFR